MLRTVLLSTVLLAAAVLPATASAAAPKVRTAAFTISLEGEQSVEWERHRIADGLCETSYDGRGSETYAFRSRRKLRVTAYRVGNELYLVTAKNTEPVLTLTGRLTRSNEAVHGPPPPDSCGVGHGDGSGPPPPAPDCGTKTVRHRIAIGFTGKPAEIVSLGEGDTDPEGPFENCPAGAPNQFPFLLNFDDEGDRIGARLPMAKLFGRKRNVVKASGTAGRRAGADYQYAEIRWTATITRVRAR